MEPQQVTPTIPTVPVPLEQKPPRSNKTFKILLLVFLFILLGAVITYAFQNYQPQPQSDLLPKPEDVPSPTPEEISLETYKNDEYAFEFQYPSHGSIEENPDGDLVLASFETKNPDGGGPFEFLGWWFTISKPFPSSTLEKEKAKLIKDAEDDFDGNIENIEEVSMAGNRALKFNYQMDYNTWRYLIFTEKGIFRIITNYVGSGYEAIPDQILSSFRFVEEPEVSVTPVDSAITGSINIYHQYETASNVLLKAESKVGAITQMRIWTDVTENNEWENYTDLRLVPYKGNEKYIYVQFKDDKGNVSNEYSTPLFPIQGKMAE